MPREQRLFDIDRLAPTIPVADRSAAFRRAYDQTTEENDRLNKMEVPFIAERAAKLGKVAVEPGDLFGDKDSLPPAA